MNKSVVKSGSRLEKILSAGQFAVTGEIGPPKSHDAGVIREKCALLKGYVDAANVTDNQTGIVRMSSIAAGILIRNEGLEPVIQMTCRDRNRLALQSDALRPMALKMYFACPATTSHLETIRAPRTSMISIPCN